MHKQKQLASLKTKMAKADLPLKDTAINLVFGEGNLDAKIFMIGEAPGRNEDETGMPFCGAAGKMLDRLLAAAQLTRQDIFLTSIVKYRPPNNRPPTFEEIKAHTPFLVKQIEIIKPDYVLPMGNFATRFILAGFDLDLMPKIKPITEVHGKSHPIKVENHQFIAFPLYHPAAVLYRRRLMDDMIQDMQKVKELTMAERQS